MNYSISRSSLALVACFAGLSLNLIHAAPIKPVVFIGDGKPNTPGSDALDPAAWSGRVLPKETDDVVINDLFVHQGPAGMVHMKSLRNEPMVGVFFRRASLSVSEDVTLNGNLEFQSSQGTLSVGGSQFLEKGALSFVQGLAKGKKGELAPRFTGKTLDMASDGIIRLRWFGDVPEGMPGNTVPFILLSGDAHFATDTNVQSVLENVVGFYPGEYLLLTTGGVIKGPLPNLTIVERKSTRLNSSQTCALPI